MSAHLLDHTSPPWRWWRWRVGSPLTLGINHSPARVESDGVLAQWWPHHTNISYHQLTLNKLSWKRIFISALFLLCCCEIVFLLPSPPLLLQMTWRPPAQQTKQWCPLKYDKWHWKYQVKCLLFSNLHNLFSSTFLTK